MPDTGWKIAGTGANVTASGAVESWDNPSNMTTASDATHAGASFDSTGYSDYLRATNFGFSVPNGVVIAGVEARVRKLGTGSATDREVKLVVGGNITGNNKAIGGVWPTSATNIDYGGASDLWGVSLEPSNVNSSNFGVVVQANDPASKSVCHVYTIWMRVHYLEQQGNTWERVSGTWRSGQFYERVSGVWRPGKLYERIGGIWRS